MSILIAVMSCERDVLTHWAQRDTWVDQRECDVRWFMGKGATEGDEINLNCDDSYEGVTEKSLKIFEWALARNYSHILHIGRDTYVKVNRLLDATELLDYDYAGHCGYADVDKYTCPLIPDCKGRYPYASGGAGSWLSRRAMQTVLDSPIRHVADDLMYGWALGAAGIPCRHDLRFQKRGEYIFTPQGITVHLSRGTGVYDPNWMREAHRRCK